MRIRPAIAAVLCAAALGPAWAESDPAHVSVGPSVAPPSPVRIASVAGDIAAFDGPLPSLTWSVGTGTSAMVGAAWKGDQLLPSIGLQHRVLTQDSVGFAVAVSASFRSVGREDTGSEVAFGVQMSRSLGVVSIATNATVGKGAGARSDVDFEAASLLAARLTRWAKIGLETRLRTELVDDFDTSEDRGRAIGLIVAPALSLSAGAWGLDVLAGWERPRGTQPDRAVGLVAAAYSF